MTQDQAMFLFEFLLPQLESEYGISQKVMLAVPPEKMGYRPDPRSRSAFELTRHIAVVEVWFLDAAIDRRFGEVAVLSDAIYTCQQVGDWYAENFTRRMLRLKELSGEDLAMPVNFIGLREYPAVACLNSAIRHSVHHRGQLSAYLRPMGARVPAIYVESADEPFSGNAEDPLTPKQPPPTF